MKHTKANAKYGPLPELTTAMERGEISPGVFRELANFPQHVQKRAIEDREFLRETLRWVREEKGALRRFQAEHFGGASVP